MKTENYKSIALVAREAAAEVMRRDVSDPGAAGSVRHALVDAWREAAERDFLERIGIHLVRSELVAVSRLNGAPYNPQTDGTPPTDAIWLLSQVQVLKALELLGQQAPDTRPVFITPARPREVPAPLRALPADTEIITRSVIGGLSETGYPRAGQHVESLESVMVRQASGIFTVAEAAQVLADSLPNAGAPSILKSMHTAYQDRKLTIRDPRTKLSKVITDFHRDHSDIVTVGDVDAWLEADGAGYKFPVVSYLVPVKTPHASPGSTHAAEPIWKAAAVKRGWEIVRGARSSTPSQNAIADQIAREWSAAKIYGPNGAALKASYIKRHALSPAGVSCKRARLNTSPKE